MSGRLGSRCLLLAAVLAVSSGCGVAGPSPAGLAPSGAPSSGSTVSPGSPSIATSIPRPTGPAATVGTRPATGTPTPSVTPTPRPSTSRSPTPRPSTSRPPTPPGTSCAVPQNLRGKDLEVIPGSGRVVALTFDAGGNDRGLTSILDTLAGEQAPASFFLTGRFATAFPQQSRTIARTYPVGNHTQSHPDLTRLSAAAARAEIRTAATNIRAVTGTDPRPYFRFPFGARDAATIGLVNGECYVPFRWTVDTLGWKGTEGGMTAEKVYRRVVDALRPGAIVLMHVGANPNDGTTLDADALPRIIQRIRAEGYALVTLDAAFPAR